MWDLQEGQGVWIVLTYILARRYVSAWGASMLEDRAFRLSRLFDTIIMIDGMASRRLFSQSRVHGAGRAGLLVSRTSGLLGEHARGLEHVATPLRAGKGTRAVTLEDS